MNRSGTQAAGNPASQPVPLDLNKLVDQYVQLRDRKRELEKQHKEQLKPFNKLMDEIGNQLLAYMQKTGLDATPTASGTAYQITKQSATIRDGAAFRAFSYGDFSRPPGGQVPHSFATVRLVDSRASQVTALADAKAQGNLEDGRALRIETVVNAPGDLGCPRRLHNLDEL